MKSFFLLAAIVILARPFVFAETEPNNTIQQANNLPYNGNDSGTFSGTDTEDWFVINIPQGGVFTLTIKKTGAGYAYMYLYDGEKTGNPEIANLTLPFGDSPAQGWTVTTPVLSGKYYVKFLKTADPVNYQVSASLVLPAFAEDQEPNDTITKAVTMPANGFISGILHYYDAGKGTDQEDWYKLSLPQGGILKLIINKKGPGNTNVRFRDGVKTGNPEISQYYTGFGESPAEGWKWSYPVLSGTYYFQIEGGGDIVDYKLDISFTAPAFPEDTEPNDTVTKALAMPVNGSVSGNVHYYANGKGLDNQDWHKISIPQGGILSLKIHKKGPGATSIHFRDGVKAGNPEITGINTGFAETPAEGLSWSYPVLSGIYYFQVEGAWDVVDYKMEVTLTAPAYGDDSEPNDTITRALAMPVNGSVSGNVHYYADGKGFDNEDWYKISVLQGGILSLKIHKKGPGATGIHFRDGIKAGNPEITGINTGFAETTAEGLSWSYPVLAGIHYFQVEGAWSPVDYKLDISLTTPPFAEDIEPNDSLKQAAKFALNDSVTGIIGYYKSGKGKDNQDWYKITTAEFGYLSFTIDKRGSNYGFVHLRDSLQVLTSSGLTFTDYTVTIGKLLPAGKYYLMFDIGGEFSYKAKMTFTPLPRTGFTWIQTGNSFAFENKTEYGENYFWDFDDGTTSNAVNPFHELLKPANYDVCLVAKNISGFDTLCKRIVIPGVTGIFPAKGGNTGDVSVEVSGGGLDTFYVAKIMQGTTEIAKSNFTYLSSKNSITTRFDLRNKPAGVYDLRIEKTSGPSYLISKAFTIETGTAADPWVKISGRSTVLANTWFNYNLLYGNNGNVDAVGVPVYITMSKNPGLDIDFSDIYLIESDTISKLYSKEEFYILTDSIPGTIRTVIYPLIIPLIPAGSVYSAKIRIKTSTDLNLKVWTEKPWFQSPPDACKAQRIAEIANKAPVKLPPAVNCFKEKLVDNLIEVSAKADKSYRFIFGNIRTNDPEYGNALFCYSFPRAIKRALQDCDVINDKDKDLVNLYIFIYINNIIHNIIGNKSKSALTGNGEGCPYLPPDSVMFKPQNPQTMVVYKRNSLDPNEKSGPAGFGAENYVSATTNIPYTIYFENKSTATAPAHTITISDQLDKTKFDLNTFSFGNISVGDTIIPVKSGLKEFAMDKKLDKLKVVCRISGKLDTITGKLEWKLRSLDPVTLEDVEDPDIGILPPNLISPEGQGSVSFFVRLKNDPTHKSTVTNQSSIVFDANPAIITNKHLTTFDLVSPQSNVQSLTSTTSARQFMVKWGGTDDGSGIENYNIYVKKDNDPYNIWLAGTTETSAVYISPADGIYQFASMAVDKTGNVESFSSVPDATTNVVTAADKPGMSDQEILVFPTSPKGEIIVNIGMPGHFTFRIYSTDGRLRMEKLMDRNSITSIKTSSLSRGLYLWQVVNHDTPVKKTGKISLTE